MSDNGTKPEANRASSESIQEDIANEFGYENEDNNNDSSEAASSSMIDELKTQLHSAEEKAESNWNEFLRAKADLENVHRRFERELEKAHKYAVEKFAQELLPVIDSLEMGMIAAKSEGADLTKVIEGTQLTFKMLNDCAGKFGIESIDPLDQPFNPEFHQAMSMQETNDKEPDTVIAVMQKGYLLHGRVIRPAMVVVSKAPSNTSANNDSANSKVADAVKNIDQGEQDTMGSRIDEKA